ncbi:MAG: hypothetical protein PWQ06_840 [Anaerophaga sp.]|nr:hypothetical protein [Anaerophaga sp.]
MLPTGHNQKTREKLTITSMSAVKKHIFVKIQAY